MADLENQNKINLHIYQKLIGKLIYFLYSTTPDIRFVIKQLGKQNINLRKTHLQVVKQVIKYQKKTIKIKFIFGKK